jgi:transmembrane sensor
MMDSKEAGFYASLLNVLTENASFEDKERVAQWINSDQENRKIFFGLKDSFHHSDSEFSSELVFARLKKRIKHDISPKFSKKNQRIKVWQIAVVTALLILGGTGFYWQINSSLVAEKGHSIALENNIVTKVNPKGEKLTIFLSDGSKVKLNANSIISYQKNFSDFERRIVLEGEAYFEVSKDKSRPFIVVSDAITTTAIGTAFNIDSYGNDGKVIVSLTEGIVKVNDISGDENFLNPGQQYLYDQDQKRGSLRNFNEEEVLAWKEGILYFSKSSRSEVIETLEMWYGVEIEMKGLISQDWKLTARFNNESLENVLKSLSYSRKFNYEIENDNIIIEML